MAKLAITRPAAGAPDIGASTAARAWPLVRAAAVPGRHRAAGAAAARLPPRIARVDAGHVRTADRRAPSRRGRVPDLGLLSSGRRDHAGAGVSLLPANPGDAAGRDHRIVGRARRGRVLRDAQRHEGPDRAGVAGRGHRAGAAERLLLPRRHVRHDQHGVDRVGDPRGALAAGASAPRLRGVRHAARRGDEHPRDKSGVLARTRDLLDGHRARGLRPPRHPVGVGVSPHRRRGRGHARVVRALAYAGGSLGHAASHAPITFAHAGENTAFYARAQLGDVLSAPLIAVLAAPGSIYLWSRNRSLLFVSIYMLTIFPLAHVPLPFANNRYMLPSLVFALLLAAHAPAAVISMTARQPALVRNTWRAMAVSVVLLLGFYYVAADAYMVWYWPRGAVRSDEAGYRQLRPTIATLPAGSLLVSGGTRGVRDSNAGIEYLDLIDYSLATDNGPERVDPIMQRIQSALDEGRPVYYLYTSVEGINITFAQSGPGYQPYFDAASQRFRLAEVRATSLKFFTLYKIEGPR